MYFATVSERDWELDVFIRNRIGINAACAYIIESVAAAVSGSYAKSTTTVRH